MKLHNVINWQRGYWRLVAAAPAGLAEPHPRRAVFSPDVLYYREV